MRIFICGHKFVLPNMLKMFLCLYVIVKNIGGVKLSENETYSISSIICSAVSERVRRNEMGALFCTIPWYLSSEESFRIQESKWAYILTLKTSRRNGSCSCILRNMMSRLISCMSTKIQWRTRGSVMRSSIAGCGLL